jgi:hypothetical protein
MSGKMSSFAGLYDAIDFAYGINPKVSPLLVISGPSATGSGTLSLVQPTTNLPDGTILSPLNTNAPITVGGNSNVETITPSAVSIVGGAPPAYGQSSVTGTFTYLHGNGDEIRSGTVGLQEAINHASSKGGGQVIISATWSVYGGTQAILEAVTVPANVSIWDNRTGGEQDSVTVTLSAAQVNTMFTTPVELLPAPAAGSFYVVNQAILVNENGGTAWTGGGAIEIGYGNANPPAVDALTGTIAATFLTSPTVKQVITLAGSQLASEAEVSTVDALGIFISNATAVFATGTGTLKVRLLYTLMTT